MKVLALADVHGNLAALDSVLQAAPSWDVVLCCGDLVGYYPDADAVCDRLRQLGARAVRGNHEACLLGGPAAPPEPSPLYHLGFTRRHLSADNLRWLGGLPEELTFRWDALQVRVRHASPWDLVTYLYPDADALRRVVLGPGELLLLGHTHHPMERAAAAGRLLNPGSVGQPRDRDPRASYALLDTASGEARLLRAPYDVAAYQERLRALGWEPELVAILSRT